MNTHTDKLDMNTERATTGKPLPPPASWQMVGREDSEGSSMDDGEAICFGMFLGSVIALVVSLSI